jgi:hypothetical protein
VIEVYVAVLAVCASSLAIGQATLGLCGWRRWSWLAPPVGLALVTAVCWATVRMSGHGAISALAVAILSIASLVWLWGRVEGGAEALRIGTPVAVLALFAASLPFAFEGHVGILGTSFNPDMSQHLLAADRLADGEASQLLRQGYPLGPHAIVVALNKGLGIGLVQAFSGLTVAVAVLAPLTALTAFSDLRLVPRTTAALLVGLAYVVASYFAQGAFKETMQALFVLAFVLALREASRAWRDLPLRFVPPALIAAGAIYTYSFPALIWLAAAATVWVIAELARARTTLGPSPIRAVALAMLAFAVLTAPELGRMIDFHSFETFDPNGPGLGNLFAQISPLEALGIWPSGDFRVAPGDGAIPAAVFYLGAVFALVLLAYGIVRCWRSRETAILSGLAAASLAYLAARIGGTPYTAAKAIEIASPLVALTILLPLLGNSASRLSVAYREKGALPPAALLAAAFAIAAGACSLLALANAPVGPTSYSPSLTELRPLLADDSTLVLAPRVLLAEQHGTPYIAWELRGGRVCIAAEGEVDDPPPGVRFVVTEGGTTRSPFPTFSLRRAAPPYLLWEATGPVRGKSPCPLIAVRQARQGAAR